MNMLLQKSSNRSAFLAWLAGELRRLSQKRNKLAMLQTFELKTGGATRSALTTAGKISRCHWLVFFFPSWDLCFSGDLLSPHQSAFSTATTNHCFSNWEWFVALSSLVRQLCKVL